MKISVLNTYYLVYYDDQNCQEHYIKECAIANIEKYKDILCVIIIVHLLYEQFFRYQDLSIYIYTCDMIRRFYIQYFIYNSEYKMNK